MWTKELSVLLSKGLIFLGMGLAAAVCIWLPDCIAYLEDYYYKPLGHLPSCVMGYVVVAMLCVLLVFLYMLLDNISKKKVFVQKNVGLLRRISWCCFAVSAVIFAWGIMSFLEVAFLVGFTVGFMGLVLRILKNVFEEAVLIKEESDYTI
ncbi:MAG: DUF2975 domain-containing protein [Oscillospiraceae bacterium]|nr:DUF2975 domain-containing protein [Oscillospiraceae bacterium]